MHDFQAQTRLFGMVVRENVWAFRKAHLTMRRRFHVRRVKSDEKGAFKALKSITAHGNASNKEKAPFFGKWYEFHKKCEIFHVFLKIMHILKSYMTFSKGAFSLKWCLKCTGRIPESSDMFE